METYNATCHYHPDLTVRNYSKILQRLKHPPPEGALWLVLLPRRYGKTWTLKELEHRLGESARYLDLGISRDDWLHTDRFSRGEYWLLDELLKLLNASSKKGSSRPAESSKDYFLKEARKFLLKCAKLRSDGATAILALTPRELRLLEDANKGDGLLSHTSLVTLAPLSPEEVRKQARTAEAKSLLQELPPAWKRTPFLLELLFQVDAATRNEGKPLALRDLLRAVLDACESTNHHYFDYNFWDALTDHHRDLLRAIVRSEAVDPRSCEPLVDAGLVEEDPATGRRWIADPVLAARLSPLRIHHLSDIHVGPKSAESIDAKEAGLLAEALDPGTRRKSYLSHLEGLRKSGKAPHVLIISGDLTEWATKEQCQEARSWLDQIKPLLEPHVLLGEDAQRILLVGGNHDVDWSRTRGGDERARHQNFADFFQGYAHPHLEMSPDDRTEKLKPIEWTDLGIAVQLLGTSELGGHIERDRERYKLLLELERLSSAPSLEERERAEKLATEAARIDPGLVHAKDLQRVRMYPWKDRLPVRIAVLHHPPSPQPTTEVARYSGLLNAGAVKQVLMEKGFCLVLCGHVHNGWFAEERWLKHSGARTLRIAAAPSLSSREIQTNNGFNLVEVFRERDRSGNTEYKVRVRRFVHQGDLGWEEHADQLGPFPPGA